MSKTVRDLIAALLFSVIAAIVFRTWFLSPYKVPTSSMYQTIQAGDHIFVNRHAYGYHFPFLDVKIAEKPIRRGDIVVFSFPLSPRIDYIKRVVGIPGDQIQIIGETVFVNGEQETMDYLYYDPELLSLPENIEIEVPDGKLWVMGDNRRNSKDSRYLGFIDVSRVQGKAVFVFWNHDPESDLTEGYQLDRIGIRLD